MSVTYNNFAAAGTKADKYLNQAKEGFKNVSTLLGKADSALIKADLNARDKTEKERFERWFGPYTQPNIDAVKNIIHTMVRQLADTGTVTIQYDPASNTFAYVYPVDPVGAAPAKRAAITIFLGSAFFTAPLLGKDSQSGTVIHELSHMNGNTDDIQIAPGVSCYGETNCKNLAIANPAQARINADNYLFYCCSFGLS
jgi:peptidyl-Lys metalloendopeptidase